MVMELCVILSGLNGTHPLYRSHGHWKVSRPDVKRWNPRKEIISKSKIHAWWPVLMCELFFNVKKSLLSCFGSDLFKGEWGELPYSIETPTLTPVPMGFFRVGRQGLVESGPGWTPKDIQLDRNWSEKDVITFFSKRFAYTVWLTTFLRT